MGQGQARRWTSPSQIANTLRPPPPDRIDDTPNSSVRFRPSSSSLRLLFFAVTVAYVAGFATILFTHVWLLDGAGRLIAYDFVGVYAAGKLALAGQPAGIYDWPTHKMAEAAALANSLSWRDYFGWHYPPPFLFAAAALALLPYLAAFFVWNVATLPFYLFVIRRVAGRAEAWLAAFAFPATFFNILVGQNGFVSAALIGGALVTLGENPILSGVLVGLMTYKPQFGILFPFALAAGGYWRTIAAAAATAIAMAIVSWLVLGSETWIAFFHSIPVTTDAVFVRGLAGWAKLNSLYGFCRWLGLGTVAAAAAQGIISTAAVGAVIALWRSRTSLSLKSAGLIAASLLATPYLYVYDLPILAVAIAFLFRAGPFDASEYVAIGLAVIAIFAFPFASAPTALIAVVLVTILITRRAIPN